MKTVLNEVNGKLDNCIRKENNCSWQYLSPFLHTPSALLDWSFPCFVLHPETRTQVCSLQAAGFPTSFFFFEHSWLTMLLVSGVQQSDSVIYIHVSINFQILLSIFFFYLTYLCLSVPRYFRGNISKIKLTISWQFFLCNIAQICPFLLFLPVTPLRGLQLPLVQTIGTTCHNLPTQSAMEKF